ncbi:MAG: CoA protein activase [Bacillota bacterium]|jgi:predicted nucleotide-binding protein (sugar kinase/HSP70/actin superfamily)
MLKVSFPHIGNSYIPFRVLLAELGLEPVIPPQISPRTIAMGTKLAPEFACLPLKVTLGNYLEALELGAELLLMAGGIGPCRFGLYGEVQREILEEAGRQVAFLVLEAPKTHPRELWEKLKRYMPRHQIGYLSRALYLAWLKADALDQFDRIALQIRPREQVAGSVNQLQNRYYEQVDRADLVAGIKHTVQQGITELLALPVYERQPLRIVLVGEIYMILEPHVNFEIEKVLGTLGVAVERTIYFTDWVREQLVGSIIHPNWRKSLYRLAHPYLNHFVGGHGLETIAHTVSAARQQAHGVIQLAPFTCMPEIVAMQALPTVSRELEIPVLSLIIDEHTAEAGILTRLEAFVDLLAYRRARKADGEKRRRETLVRT